MNNNDIKGSIISAILGAAFFAIPYIGLNISLVPSLIIGVAAFGAGSLILSDSSKKEIDLTEEATNSKKSFDEMIEKAKKQNAEIYFMIDKVENKELQKNIAEIHDTVEKIIDTISASPEKLEKMHTFFDYYLPVTLKILINYDTIENQDLESSESKKFMESAEEMVAKINKSFEVQLSNLYQSDMIDTDAEMKVFENMLKSEGMDNKKDFEIRG